MKRAEKKAKGRIKKMKKIKNILLLKVISHSFLCVYVGFMAQKESVL